MPTYPPGAPTISGHNITVSMLLRNPTRVRRIMEDLTKERFVGDRVFGSGPADGGAVIYDRVTEQDLYLEDDIEEIAPGSEYPIVGGSDPTSLVAQVVKRGAKVKITYEDERRNDMSVVRRRMRQLANTIVRRHDIVALAAMAADADMPHGDVEAVWDTGTPDPFGDIAAAKSEVENSDLGYIVDCAVINPEQELQLLDNDKIRNMLPRENVSVNPTLSGKLAGLAGIRDWIVSNRAPAGTLYLGAAKMLGSIHDEIPQYAKVIEDEDTDCYWIKGGRISVPVITDPLSFFRLTGINT